ncbi:MAG: hypothetical protein AAFW73_00220 [Bacteroidota bacterium]
MKLLKGLYWHPYLELSEQGKSTASVRRTGTILVALVVLLNTAVVLMVLQFVWPAVGEGLDDLLRAWFGRRSGRSVGRFLGALGLGLAYLPVWLTWGSERGYARLMEELGGLSEADQQRYSERSFRYLLASIGLFFLLLFLFFFEFL